MDENRTAREPRKNKPARRRRRRGLGVLGALVYVVFVIGVSVLLATFGWTLANDVLALNKPEHTAEVTLPASLFETKEVKEESIGDDGEITTQVELVKVLKEGNLDRVTLLLKENGIIEEEWLFKLFVAVSKSERKFQPGTYTLHTGMDYRAVITNMGSVAETKATVDVTFPEGSTVDQIFKLMEEKGVASVEDLQKIAAEHDFAFSFLQDIPLGDYRRLEGYLFPDTYKFYLNDNPKRAINKLLVNFDNKVTEEMRAQVEESGYTLHEIVTISSLIEKETDGHDEKKIASVIYNRLNNPGYETAGLLQIDAALVYVNGGRVPTQEDKQMNSPYNTYINPGLTPGPIANPGMAAIYAAMNAEETDYYYYVLNPETNRHEYSTNYEEHRKLVDKYASD